MPDSLATALFYGVPLALALAFYARGRRREHHRSLARLEASRADGLVEPPSLHPVINPNRCLGCGTCVGACPEGGVLGLVAGRAELVEPSRCIGHGACREACPTDAITLVLGTATRGVEIPILHPDFETNVPGIFVAGELGGMGLIRNAVEQGRQAVASIAERARPGAGGASGVLDLAIVGAGPAGFSASLAAQERGLRYVTLEQESLGGTVAHYPRGKIVMTAPVDLPLVGKVRMHETTKEALLAFWQAVARRTSPCIRYGERVEAIERRGDVFELATVRGVHRARRVLLAIGRRGSPRKLGVPGEEASKVVYRLIEPEQYRGSRVLVVGGGDSALEAAARLAEEPGTAVALSHRKAGFDRARPANRERVARAAGAGRLRVVTESAVEVIHPDRVDLGTAAGPLSLANDAVIVCAGGVLPTRFLEAAGIGIERKHGTPLG